jgi:hypothetical protein
VATADPIPKCGICGQQMAMLPRRSALGEPVWVCNKGKGRVPCDGWDYVIATKDQS